MPIHERIVRVFVSSTFHDMQVERDALVKRVFPELRLRCRSRQVEFIGVDLRWGITEEQSARGEVLPVCFAEIERCRPYFVALLGDRYGSSLDSISDAVLHRYSWVGSFRERSVTELEIRHAVIMTSHPVQRALFYFRTPGTTTKGLSARKKGCKEIASHAQQALKDDIRASGYPVRENCDSPEMLEKLILEDLWQAICDDFPEQLPVPVLEQRRTEHEAFAAARRRNYIARKKDFTRLDTCALGAGQPLAITGEAGGGKSALLANWIARFRAQHPDIPVVAHFTGASQEAAEPVALLRRLTEELSAIAGTTSETPAAWHSLTAGFPDQLAAAASKGPFVLVLDGLDQLSDAHNAPDLGWLPRHIPPNVRLIVSTLEGRALKAVSERGWPVMSLGPLLPGQRRRLITKYLKHHGRALSPSSVARITTDQKSANPLYLTVFMEELMVFGYYDRLSERIEHYLKAADTVELYELMLERIESDCDGVRPALTGDALGLLWASRGGLRENEIRDCLGTRKTPLPMAHWSPLFLALGEALIVREGRLTFFHDHLRRAVERRYLATTAKQRRMHSRLAMYFGKVEEVDRHLEEWPYQLFRSGARERLADCITTPEVFEALGADARLYELDRYWMALATRFDLVRACAEALARLVRDAAAPARVARYAQEVGRYLSHRGEFAAAETWLNDAGHRFEQAGEQHRAEHADLLRHLGTFLMHSGRAADAEPVLTQAVALLDDVFGAEFALSAVTLSLLAEVRRSLGQYQQSKADYQAALPRLEIALGPGHIHIATVRSNLAGLLLETGDFAGAEEMYRQSVAETERVLGPNHVQTAHILNNLASTLVHAGRPAEAEPLHRRAIEILTESVGPDNPYTLTTKATWAYALQALGRYQEAETVTRDVLAQRERLHGIDHPEVATTREYLAGLLAARGEYAEAEKIYLATLPALEATFGPAHRVTADCMIALAQLYHTQGKYPEAEPYYHKAIAAFDAHLGAAHLRTVNARMSLAHLLGSRGAVEEAATMYHQTMQTLEVTNNIRNAVYANCVIGYGIVLRKLGKLVEAESAIKRAIALYEELLGTEHAQTCIGLKTLADLYTEQDRLAEAETLLMRALDILEKALGPDHPHTISIAREPLERIRKRIAEKG